MPSLCRTSTLSLALALTTLTGCTQLSSFFGSSSDGGLEQVDALLGQIEQVHVESVLARQRVAEAHEQLAELVSPDYGGDALAAYARFVDAIDRSEEQAAALDERAAPMRRSGEAFFADWKLSLDQFHSEELRERSRQRMETTRERYRDLLKALEPAREDHARLNALLRDHARLLGHDFNAEAVATLGAEIAAIGTEVDGLDRQLASCQRAAREYVHAAALRGQLALSRAEVEGAAGHAGALAQGGPASASEVAGSSRATTGRRSRSGQRTSAGTATGAGAQLSANGDDG